MRPILPMIIALVVLAIVASGGVSAQPAGDTRPPAGGLPPPANLPLPSVQRDEAPSRTPAEWRALLERRRAELAQQKIERVAPLPAQRITPPGITPPGITPPPPAPSSSPLPQ